MIDRPDDPSDTRDGSPEPKPPTETPRTVANRVIVDVLNNRPVYVSVATTGISDSDVVVGLSILDSGKIHPFGLEKARQSFAFYHPLKSDDIAQRIHGINHTVHKSDEHPDGLKTLHETLPEILDILDDRVVVAWNAHFAMSKLFWSLQSFSRHAQKTTMLRGVSLPRCLWVCSQQLISHRILDTNPMNVPSPMRFTEAVHRTVDDMEVAKTLIDRVSRDEPLKRLEHRNSIQKILMEGVTTPIEIK